MSDSIQEAVKDTQAQAAEEGQISPPLSRREFLYYLWASSMVVFMAGGAGATIWLTIPRIREGEFGGVFTIPIADLPAADTGPKEFAEGRFWLINIGPETAQDTRQPAEYASQTGIRAIYKVCTHLGCLYKWVPTNDRFECPCHGSKFLQTGSRIDGPARRNLDQFIVEVIDQAGQVLARTEPSYPPGNESVEGTSLQIPPNAISLRIDTGRRINGAVNTKPGGGA
jgi:cytochrome b6-f complex iron-sulfur subunit